MTTYSYSLDRELWLGQYDSRSEAAQAGIAHAMRETMPPESVFVGQRIAPDVRAYGHACSIIDSMRRRVREDNGELADGFLKRIGESQVNELDDMLEATIRQWMRKNELCPSWVRVEAVGEYPMPMPAGTVTSGRNGEVHDIGVEDHSVL